MHREPLNQEILNVLNFMIIPIVMAIIFFLVVQPCSGVSSYLNGAGHVFASLFCAWAFL